MNFEMSSQLSLVVFIGLFLLNVGAFILVGLDKNKSRGNLERTPEINFFVWAVCFASLGVILGMFYFHHKTRKLSFVLGIGLLLIEQVFIVSTIINF